MQNIIFPVLYNSRKIEPFWEREAEAAKAAGFKISLASDQNEAGPVTVSNKAESRHLLFGTSNYL